MAAITLSSPQVSVNIATQAANIVSTLAGTQTMTGNMQLSNAIAFGVGSAAGQVQYIYNADRNVTAGTLDTIQLSTAGALKDPAGNTLNFGNVGALVIRNPSTNTCTLTLAQTASNGVVWGQLPANTVGLICTPGSALVLMDNNTSMAVAPGSADKITITSNAGTNVYTIEILGR